MNQTASSPFLLFVPVDNWLMILLYSSGSRVFSVFPKEKGIIAETVGTVKEMSDPEVQGRYLGEQMSCQGELGI